MLDPNDPQQMLGYTYANDNPVSGSDPTGLINASDGDGGGGYTDDDVDVLYPSGGANDNPNPLGPNGGYGGGHGGGNDDGGSNHPQKKKHWWQKATDHARQWADEHAADIGNGIAIGVAVVGTVAFCAGTAGVGCVIVAGAVMGAAGASLGYSTRIALSESESFDTATYAKEVVVGGATGAATGAAGVGLSVAVPKVVGAVGKMLTGKAAASPEPAASEAAAEIPKYARKLYTRFTPKARTDALAKAPTCPYCGKADSTQADHITSLKTDWESGGWEDSRVVRSTRVNSPDNLIGACQPCNGSKSSKVIGPGEGQWWPSGWPAGVWWPFGGP
ncbi:HNH endonuclease [Kribbella sp. NPDC051587]|uniref:HNH endonuclease n=1 Tax=Kribbella sp. NPDC051587 TaxID=3364119 RepID=UPI0037ACCE08